MAPKRILFICGSLNQTTMMHQISRFLPEHHCVFTPFYCDGFMTHFQRIGWLEFTIIGGQNRRTTESYFAAQGLEVDYGGAQGNYDLYLTCTDLYVPNNLRDKQVILVQEGMTDPENIIFHVVKRLHRLGVPRWIASTSTTGLSDQYIKFCVASPGYREHFVKKGVRSEKVVVTGIPNFDNVEKYYENDFPHKDYALVATTDTRENFKWDNRKKFLQQCKEKAGGLPLVFKLHPNENYERSYREIKEIYPEALVFQKGNAAHMVANSKTLITQYSTLAYIGLALNKKVYSYFDMENLKQLLPIQNGGTSARNIADVCRFYL